MAFVKAERKRAKFKIGVTGPSGAGKTYSSLLLARGLAGEGGKIAVIDTERNSSELCADLTDFYVSQLSPPYSPNRYIEAIQEAEREGFEVLIVDSLSHAWAGDGGILSLHERAANSSRSSNSFAAWAQVTPLHNALLDQLFGCSMHTIMTLRTKTAYELIEDDHKKRKPVKIGLAPIQRDGIEYEFGIVLDLAQDTHLAQVSKDRTHVLDGSSFVPTVEHGAKLREWGETGASPSDVLANRAADLIAELDTIEDQDELSPWYRRNKSLIQSLGEHESMVIEAAKTRREQIQQSGEVH